MSTKTYSTNSARELLREKGAEARTIRDLLKFFDLKSGSIKHGSPRIFTLKADFDEKFNAAK